MVIKLKLFLLVIFRKVFGGFAHMRSVGASGARAPQIVF